MNRKITFRISFLILFFVLQVFGIVMGRFTQTKYFCWAPYDEISFYEISVTINDRELNDSEIYRRYRKTKRGRENRSIHNVISIVRQHETTYGSEEAASVEISYLINGHRQATWIWPEDEIIPKN